MDSNFSRLYLMLNDESDVGTNVERSNSESKNLLNTNDFFILNANDSLNNHTTATLEVSSTTIINGINFCHDGFKATTLNMNTTREAVKSNDTSNEIQMEYHFNPLYIISDQNTNNNELNNQNSTSLYIPNSSIYDQVNHQLFSPPSDQYGLIYMALLLAGVGFLLPYNSFMIAVDYFQQRFPNTTIVFDMSTTYIVIAFVTVIIQNFFVETIPLFWRLNLGYLLSFVFMIFVVIYEIWARLGSYFDNLIVISIISVGCTIQQSTFYGYTSMLPKRYVQAVMTGESAVGVLVSMNRIITKFLYPQDPEYSTVLFFTISIVVILLCAIVHIILLPRSDFIRYHIFLCNQKPNDGAHIMHQINENVGLVNMYHNNLTETSTLRNSNDKLSSDQNFNLTSKNFPNQRPSIFSTESNANSENNLDNLGSVIQRSTGNLNNKVQNMLRTDSTEFVFPFGIDDEEITVEHEHSQQPLTDDSVDLNNNSQNGTYSVHFKSSNTRSLLVRWLHSIETSTHFLYYLRRIFLRIRKCDKSLNRFMNTIQTKYFIRKNIVSRIWPYIISIILVYFVTLTIFPGIESEIYSCRFGDWFPIILMATFNLTDFFGKLISTLFYRINRLQLLSVSMLRFILIPLFALSITPRTNPFFANPCWPILFSIILGITNGIFGSLPMILAPFKINEKMREITGNLMTFSYVIGLTSGSFASYALNNWTANNTLIISSNMTTANEYDLLYRLCYNNSILSSSTILPILAPTNLIEAAKL